MSGGGIDGNIDGCTRLLTQTFVVIRAHSVIAEVTLVAWLRKVSCPDVHEVSVHIFTSVTGPQVKPKPGGRYM